MRHPRRDHNFKGPYQWLSLRALRQELHEQWGRTKEERRRVISKYARRSDTGSPVLCFGMKVTFNTEKAATAAARELEQLGARCMSPYPCRYADDGHVHLTTDWEREEYRHGQPAEAEGDLG